MKYLHIMVASKRMLMGYVTMLRAHFPADEHPILYRSDVPSSERILMLFDNVMEFADLGNGKLNKFKGLKKLMKEVDHIVWHGFNLNAKWVLFMYLHKRFLKKSSWLIWGIDIYNYIRPKTSLKNRLLNYIETKCRKIIPDAVVLNEADIPVYHDMISDRKVTWATYPIAEENWQIMDEYLKGLHILDENGNVVPAELRENDDQTNFEYVDGAVEYVGTGNHTDLADDNETEAPSEESGDYSSVEKLLRSLFLSDKDNDPDNNYKITLEFQQTNNETHFVYHREISGGKTADSDPIKIIVGNNAHHFNKHQQILLQLKKFKDENIMIYVPLSYGNDYHSAKMNYTESIKQYVASEFPDKKYQILTKLMPQNKYTKLLTEFDIGIFPADRQNALGNINKMLYMGKKVYLSNKNPLYDFFVSKGFEIHDVEELNDTSYEEFIRPISVEYPNPWLKDFYSSDGSARLWQKVFDKMNGKKKRKEGDQR